MPLSKFQLAEDWDPRKVRFPGVAQPKYDGVRAGNLFGRLSGRSLKQFGNRHATLFFSQNAFLGLDGEMAAGHEHDPSLCRLTTSALASHEGNPWLMWHVFDYLRPETVDLPYFDRYNYLLDRVHKIKTSAPELGAHLTVMPARWIMNMQELECIIEEHGDLDLEGTIYRLNVPHKNGRSSPTHGGLLRIKSFIEVDCLIERVVEGRSNQNEATINANGHTERSTHQANMIPNGMVGSLLARLLEDARHPFNGSIVHRKGEAILFGAGRLTHDERRKYFVHQDLIIGKRMKGQIFPHGVKDKTRFPTFQSLRDAADVIER